MSLWGIRYHYPQTQPVCLDLSNVHHRHHQHALMIIITTINIVIIILRPILFAWIYPSSSSSTCFEDHYHCKLRSKSDCKDDEDQPNHHQQQDYLGDPPPLVWFTLKPWALWGISSTALSTEMLYILPVNACWDPICYVKTKCFSKKYSVFTLLLADILFWPSLVPGVWSNLSQSHYGGRGVTYARGT